MAKMRAEQPIAVIGAGSWGTALAQLLAAAGNPVRLWAHSEPQAQAINETHHNPRYLVDARLSDGIVASSDLRVVLEGAEAAVLVTPSAVMREMACNLREAGVRDELPLVICFKGIEQGTGCIPAEVLAEELGCPERIAVLSGPNHAEEVVKGVPAGTVIASSDAGTATFFQNLFATDAFRTYVSEDVVGVEVCAAYKNVIAIAVGMSYGLGFGDNTASMLLTRGLAEMSRLVAACGGNSMTCLGLAGTGDLVATCMSRHSRNRTFGEGLAQGESLEAYSARTHMVVEGAQACKSLVVLSERYGVELPIADVVRRVVWEEAPIRETALGLFDRPLKPEFY